VNHGCVRHLRPAPSSPLAPPATCRSSRCSIGGRRGTPHHHPDKPPLDTLTSTTFMIIHPRSPIAARLIWRTRAPLAAHTGVHPEPHVDHLTGSHLDNPSHAYLRPQPIVFCPPSPLPTLSAAGKPPAPPLFCPFWTSSMAAHPTTVSSARTGPGAPSELGEARQHVVAPPHRLEHHCNIAVPPLDHPLGESPRRARRVLPHVQVHSESPTDHRIASSHRTASVHR
jgi:hypothetical protein